MIRALAAVVIGVVLAVGASVAAINAGTSRPDPVNKQLYRYGSR